MSLLSIIADNPKLFEELKELCYSKFASPEALPVDHSTISNEQLGQLIRAKLMGIPMLDEIFAEISSHSSIFEAPTKANPGR